MGSRRLTKSDNRVIAGVCGGVADFFGWNPVLTRIVWALCILLGGFGLFFYIAMWAVMPRAPKKSFQDRMQEKLDERKRPLRREAKP